MNDFSLASKPFTGTSSVGVFTRKLRRNPHIRAVFNKQSITLKPSTRHADKIDLVVGWGLKKQALKAKAYAERNLLRYQTIEDGFIHSMSQGRLGAKSWSIVTDSQGIYYDATRPSDLELLITKIELTHEQRDRAARIIKNITSHNITKYNNAIRLLPLAFQTYKDTVLVIDQVKGDLSIPCSLAGADSFKKMIEAAINENPNSVIVIKTHPDVINGKRKGCINLKTQFPHNVHILSENINSAVLIKNSSKVYVVSSQMGFDALLADKKVVCFGAPFYACWGLTDDRLDRRLDVFNRRKKNIDIESLFYAAYIEYSHYLHPDTWEACNIEDIISFVKLQYKIRDQNRGKLYCIGFTPWKRRFMRHYLETPENEVFFPLNQDEALQLGFDKNSTSCIWSSKHEKDAESLKLRFNTEIWRIEDGFIRSVSLGSNYAPPSSLIIDKTGLYFDPTRESTLENILSDYNFSPLLKEQASKLRNQIIQQAVSKYNVGATTSNHISKIGPHKHRILIPGQVSDDASIQKGCKDIMSNMDLIKKVREQNPNSFIIYKPHPDVVSKNRKGKLDNQSITEYCDLIVEDVSITECLGQVDEVHTMTSLVGFEALIRGLSVHCYGIPFYSGWGLTNDRHTCRRRSRRLDINELTAAVLILYPVYINWESKCYTTPQLVISKIHECLTELQCSGRHISTFPTKWAKLKKKISLVKTMLNPVLK